MTKKPLVEGGKVRGMSWPVTAALVGGTAAATVGLGYAVSPTESSPGEEPPTQIENQDVAHHGLLLPSPRLRVGAIMTDRHR